MLHTDPPPGPDLDGQLWTFLHPELPLASWTWMCMIDPECGDLLVIHAPNVARMEQHAAEVPAADWEHGEYCRHPVYFDPDDPQNWLNVWPIPQYSTRYLGMCDLITAMRKRPDAWVLKIEYHPNLLWWAEWATPDAEMGGQAEHATLEGAVALAAFGALTDQRAHQVWQVRNPTLDTLGTRQMPGGESESTRAQPTAHWRIGPWKLTQWTHALPLGQPVPYRDWHFSRRGYADSTTDPARVPIHGYASTALGAVWEYLWISAYRRWRAWRAPRRSDGRR